MKIRVRITSGNLDRIIEAVGDTEDQAIKFALWKAIVEAREGTRLGFLIKVCLHPDVEDEDHPCHDEDLYFVTERVIERLKLEDEWEVMG